MKKLGIDDCVAKSEDLVADNVRRLKRLFPEAFTEGKIDFDVLKQLLGGSVDEREEKYGLTWHGKRRARQLALTPSTGTLRPRPDESVDWETTRNLVIEGDNLEVLKLLQKSYAGRVKLIYIDPPYNTGKDFVYPDNFQDNIRNYLELTGQLECGRKITSNTESSGRFHTDWLNMMYPRLKLARNLLREDGVIFVSIDDHELASVRKLGDEIFGEENFEGHVHWRRRHNQPNDSTKMIGLVAEHIIVYAKNSANLKDAGVGKIALTGSFSNPDGDPRGGWASKPWKVGADQSGSHYKITTPAGLVLEEDWMGEESTFKSLLDDGRIIFPDKGKGMPRKKYFKTERAEEGQCATNWWPHDQFGHNQGANSGMEALLGKKNVFSNPKPVELLSSIIAVGNVRDAEIVVDFFAGSGTAGHAVMVANAADSCNRRYILVQLPEALDPENEDQRIAAHYCDKIHKPRTIAELTKERLRRAGEKIREELLTTKNTNSCGPCISWTKENLPDLGFRVFKLDASNIRAWDPDPAHLEQSLLSSQEHLVEGRTETDILYELLLKLGLDLCVPVETRIIIHGTREPFRVFRGSPSDAPAGSHTAHSIGGGALLVCLSPAIPRADVEPLAMGIVAWHEELKPAGETTVVFRDGAFADDVAKTNLAAILEQHGIRNVRSL